MRALRFLLLLLVPLCASAPVREARAEDRPNVLLILVDDLKPAMGAYGDDTALTPNLDALAERGMRFDAAYCNQAVCAPSRYTLMLGSHSTSTGLYGLGSPLRKLVPDAVTLPQHFAAHGYRTESLGKIFHIGHGNLGDPESFSLPHFKEKVIEYADPASKPGGALTREEAMFENVPAPPGGMNSLPRGAAFEMPVVEDDAYADGRVAEETMRRLQAAKQRREQDGTPFFIAAGFARPHLPFSAPRQYWDLYDPAALPMPEFEDLPAGSPPVAGKRGGEIRNYFPVPDKNDPAPIPDEVKRQLIHGYYASTSYVDAQIGKVIDELDRLSLAENTIIVLWGDHGFHLGDLGIWTKHTNYEQANRIPILITAPGVTRPGTATGQPAESVDLYPTLAELAGLPAPEGPQPIDGISLVPVLKDPEARVRDHAFHAYPKARMGRAIRTERYRLVEWKQPGADPSTAEIELYDYQEDPLETRNHAAEQPTEVARLRAILDRYPEAVGQDGKRSPKTKEKTRDAAASPASTPPASLEVPTPEIANRPLAIRAEVRAPKPAGVVLAQGGREHGYALHFIDSRPALDVRVDGRVTRLAADKGVTGKIRLVASITAEELVLSVNGEPGITTRSPGLIPVQPLDTLSLGFDDKSAAGDYASPNRFSGEILKATVTPGDALAANAKPPDTANPGTRWRPGTAAKPLFADPHYHGSCDPEIVWNEAREEWFLYYTARRATRKQASYVGTPIGVLSSPDLKHWTFRGYCSFDGKKGEPDNPDTHWAPGIIVAGDTLHMFATYKDNAEAPWAGNGVIRHYTAPLDDPIDGWKLRGIPEFNQPDPIDVSLLKISDDEYRAYYRVGKGGGLQWATSSDLVTWENHGPCPGDVNADDRGFGYQEAPYVFAFGDAYWMLTDPHDGLAVFRSDDAITWTQQERILKAPGTGPQDATLARHPSVAVIDDRAFIFYHTEPNRPYPSPPAEKRTVLQKKSYLQIAELTLDGATLVCDRDATVMLDARATGPWSAERARTWYDDVYWPVGANFVPSTAINPLEMWQAETFDPETIDRELGWARDIGMNTMRVFLHDLAWQADPEGFLDRVDQYLEIADRHHIRTMLVFFDGVWNPSPQAGPQPEPRPHVHNSGWIQSPGRDILDDPEQQDALKPYVQAVISRFKDDPRVLVWDLFNEPDNANVGAYGGDSERPDLAPPLKKQRALELLAKTFAWAREIDPSQPLTAGVWGRPDWLTAPDAIERLSLELSDVISFHSYDGPDTVQRIVEQLAETWQRPILCTEYVARANGSTFEAILPIFNAHKVGAYNWGLVDGDSQTKYPWDSWKSRYTKEPEVWHHDIFRRDGTPYSAKETRLIRQLINQPPTEPSTAPAIASPMPRAEIEAGLRSHDRALFVHNAWIRDPYISRGEDDWFYLTGTTPNPGDRREQSDPYNTGLGDLSLVGWKAHVWRSKDLIDWQDLGTPFTLEDGIWFGEKREAFANVAKSNWRLWAPELHWLPSKARWALVHTSPSPVAGANLSLSAGAEVSGPWENPMGAAIERRHDPSLFRDDDGSWWLIWGATKIARLAPDFSAIDGDTIAIKPSGDADRMGHEGCLIMKIHGKYVLFGTGWSTGEMRRGSYNLYYATADEITGPYSERQFAGRFLGHGTPFQDGEGRWWCTAFYNGNVPPLPRDGIESRDLSVTAQTINQRGTTLVPLDVRLLDDGSLHIRAKDSAYATPGPDEAQDFGE